MALLAIASQQINPTEETNGHVHQFLDYMATHPDAKFDSAHPTWSSTSIPMLPILAPYKHKVVLVATISLAAFHVTATLSSSMALVVSL
jgi:hypothetical protein